jgi:geranylgeranyl diphosphate synthase type I
VAGDFLDPERPASPEFRALIDARIAAFLDRQAQRLAEIGPELAPVSRLARELLAGGKRLRPAFCAAGYLAAAGQPDEPVRAGLLEAAASLELLHVSALVHDDVMDSSDLRRGQPAAHRQFESQHATAGWLGDPATHGRSGAILLGDLLLMWSVEMLRAAPLPAAALAAGAPIAEAMRTEVTAGQYLDVLAQARPLSESHEDSHEDSPGDLPEMLAQVVRVVEFKSARYTVRRPCQLGAALGAGSAGLQACLAAYGTSLGRSFQFRDDLLGVFGDPAVTGKPAGDDLREGKRTVLVAQAYARTDAPGQDLLRRRLGDPELDPSGVAELRQVIIASGAREAVEQMIDDGYATAMAALGQVDMAVEGRTALTALASAAVHRSA